MIELNNEKTFICVRFYTADGKLCEYEKFFGEKSKNRDKLIQSGTPEQHTKNRHYPGKTGTVGMFVDIKLSIVNQQLLTTACSLSMLTCKINAVVR